MAVDWLVALQRHTAVDGLILRMRCEHPIVSGVRVGLVVVDLDLLRSHALHCDWVLFKKVMVYNSGRSAGSRT